MSARRALLAWLVLCGILGILTLLLRGPADMHPPTHPYTVDTSPTK